MPNLLLTPWPFFCKASQQIHQTWERLLFGLWLRSAFSHQETLSEGMGWRKGVLQLRGQPELAEPLPAHGSIQCFQDFAFSCR